MNGRQRRWAWWILASALVVCALVIGLASQVWRVTPAVRDRIVDALNAEFSSDVALASLEASLLPRPALAGSGLVLRHNGRADVPPLLSIPRFSASAGPVGLVGRRLHLRTVELDGLDIRIPSGGLKSGSGTTPSPAQPGVSSEPGSLPQTAAPPAPRVAASGRSSAPLIIDRVRATRATLEIASNDPARLPRLFEIHDLVMEGFGQPSAAPFRASLTNPKPAGRIDTEGAFGPWDADDPRLTPISGEYLFGSADLDTIKGISGILSSGGRYKGVLERVEVSGHTDTPDFAIDIAGQPVHLKTTFDAVVDGTNGNTWLERVAATLGETTVMAKGAVVRARDVKGRHISVTASIHDGRIEDILTLAVKGDRPPLTGIVNLDTQLLIPAGDEDVVDKLELDGSFELVRARFSRLDIQKRINTLSSRGQGDADSQGEGPTVVSNLRGRFVMSDASIRFSRLTFSVPGATVQLAGRYHLRSEALAFAGDLLLDASLASTMTGFRSLMARLVQPFFRRPGGGSRIPIRITGTRDKPTFGLDFGRVFGR